MPKKDEKQGQQPSKAAKRSTQRASPKRTKPALQGPGVHVEIGGDVTESVVSVRVFSRGWLTQRIQQYRRRPSLLLFDFPYLCIILSILASIGFLVFIFLYYGSNTTIFSNTGSLLLFSTLDSLAFRLLFVGGITFLIVSSYRFFWLHITRSALFSSALSISFLALIGLALLLSAAKLRRELIKINYPLSRADEFVRVGRFDLAKEILLLYPEAERMPASAREIAQERDSQEEIFPPPGEAEAETSNETLKTFENVVSKLYTGGQYQETMRVICNVSQIGLSAELRHYWRGAAYMISHDPQWGPESTLNWINELNNQYPDCKKIASPFWLAIPPEIVWLMQERNWDYGAGQLGALYAEWTGMPLDRTTDEALPDRNIRDICKVDPAQDLSKVSEGSYALYRRCEYDLRLAEEYLQRFPEDQYADYAKFILGHLDQVIEERGGHDSDLYDYAVYEKGWRQYQENDFEGALKTFQAFLYIEDFQAHPWRDDALWRAAMCYKHLGKYIDALQYLSNMEGATDGYVPDYADMNASVLNIADVLMPIDDLARVVSENLFPNLLPLLKYTLAERLLASGSYAEARRLFVEIRDQYTGQVFEPPRGKKFSFAVLADQKIKVIDILMSYQKEHPDDGGLFVADYLDTYDAFAPLENDLRYYLPYDTGTAEYLTARSKTYVAAKLREGYVDQHPQDPRVPDLLFQIAQGYETVASWEALPASADFLPMVRKKASDSYLKYLDHVANQANAKFDHALEHAGSLYLTRCLYDSEFQCDMDSIKGMREVYLQLVNKYPHHRLANNFLNWIAWSYCYEANLPDTSDQQYVDAYRLALATYFRIATNYPDGPIGENARRNMPVIEDKIKNPAKRAEFAPAKWDW